MPYLYPKQCGIQTLLLWSVRICLTRGFRDRTTVYAWGIRTLRDNNVHSRRIVKNPVWMDNTWYSFHDIQFLYCSYTMWYRDIWAIIYTKINIIKNHFLWKGVPPNDPGDGGRPQFEECDIPGWDYRGGTYKINSRSRIKI